MTVQRTGSDPEGLFLSSLPAIDRIVALLGRRYGLSDADTEEFASWARERLINDTYSVFRRWAGRSSLPTYLSVVLANLFKDYRNSRWGRWRPSAVARRLGPVAIRLETLLYRDGHRVAEAVEVLKATGWDEAGLRALAARIPPRAQVREVALDAAVASVAAEPADRPPRGSDQDEESSETSRTIADAMQTLRPEDQVIVRMRYWDDFSVADIARTLGLEQKPLYHRLESIHASLGAALTARGMDLDRIAALLTHGEAD